MSEPENTLRCSIFEVWLLTFCMQSPIIRIKTVHTRPKRVSHRPPPPGLLCYSQMLTLIGLRGPCQVSCSTLLILQTQKLFHIWDFETSQSFQTKLLITYSQNPMNEWRSKIWKYFASNLRLTHTSLYIWTKSYTLI